MSETTETKSDPSIHKRVDHKRVDHKRVDHKRVDHKRVDHKRVDHLANERTFLAWIRTCIGIMAFGFVVERFALFLRQTTYFLKKEGLSGHPAVFPSGSLDYSSMFGVLLVVFGAVLGLLAFVSYKRTALQIESDTYRAPSQGLALLLTAAVVILGIFLAIYILQ
jgi:uncharacterized membrane protein YidH (DUF202 family)